MHAQELLFASAKLRLLAATCGMLALESCKPQEPLCCLKLETARTAFALRYLDRKNFFAVTTLTRRNTPLLIRRHSGKKIVLMFSFFNTKGRVAILKLASDVTLLIMRNFGMIFFTG